MNSFVQDGLRFVLEFDVLSLTETVRMKERLEATYPGINSGQVDWEKVDAHISLNHPLQLEERLDRSTIIRVFWDRSDLAGIRMNLGRFLDDYAYFLEMGKYTYLSVPEVGFLAELTGNADKITCKSSRKWKLVA